jgi:putative DNA primase/helicase
MRTAAKPRHDDDDPELRERKRQKAERVRREQEQRHHGANGAAHPGGNAQEDGEAKGSWDADLERSPKTNIPKGHHMNAEIFLERHPELAGRIRYNCFAEDIEGRDLPWRQDSEWSRWLDEDDTGAAIFAQRNGLPLVPATLAETIAIVAKRNLYNPVREWLDSLIWDGVPRLSTWPTEYLGVEPTPYMEAIARAWPISAVARIYKPGCKADHVLLLEGRQGLLKSTALRTLFGSTWFSDDIADLGTKDSALGLRGNWCVEIAELSAMRRSAIERVKSFLTRQIDDYRPPYGRRNIKSKRQCVFAATTNVAEWLEDFTGGRRFWRLRVEQVDLARLAADREQLWAEAVHAFKNGELWWLTDQELIDAADADQEAMQVADPWHRPILDYIERYPSVELTSERLLQDAIGRHAKDHTRADQTRVGNILQKLGFTPRQVRREGGRPRVYERRSGQ